MICIKKLKPVIILSTILLFVLAIIYVHSNFKIYSNSQKGTVISINEKRGTPPYSSSSDKYMIPHMEVFFWVPKNPSPYIAFFDKSIKTYISRHGAIGEWKIFSTGKTTKTEKEIYVFVPKSFMLVHGSGFYKLIHMGIAQKG